MQGAGDDEETTTLSKLETEVLTGFSPDSPSLLGFGLLACFYEKGLRDT